MRKAIQDTGKFGNATDYNICSQIMELRVGWDILKLQTLKRLHPALIVSEE